MMRVSILVLLLIMILGRVDELRDSYTPTMGINAMNVSARFS